MTEKKPSVTDVARGIIAISAILAVGVGCIVQGQTHNVFFSVGATLIGLVVFARLLCWLHGDPAQYERGRPELPLDQIYPSHMNTYPDNAICASCGRAAKFHTKEFLHDGPCNGFVLATKPQKEEGQ